MRWQGREESDNVEDRRGESGGFGGLTMRRGGIGIGTILLAWLLLNEVPTLMQIAGAVLILGGILAAARPEHGVAGPASAADRDANLTTP